MLQPVRVGICSTYAPRACGLATFSADLERSLRCCKEISEVGIIAMVDQPSTASDLCVVAEIDQQSTASYSAAARVANNAFDIVILQHEFGIFGGLDGEFVLRFLADLRIPVIVTLHTVLPKFSAHQTEVLRRISQLANAVTVFTPTAVDLLLDQQLVCAEKIHVIPHGAPEELYGCDRDEARKRLDVHERYVVSTFGLVSPGKGLELAIEAISLAVQMRPDLLFIVAGQTHPGVHRVDGESYRRSLTQKVRNYGLENYVRFLDEFLPIEGIADLLAATNIFTTTYVNPEQIVSGALTFALAAGVPVVSTAYRYAVDQLSSGAGIIVHDRQAASVADAILRFASDQKLSAAAAQEAARIGAALRWTATGRSMAMLAFDQCQIPNASLRRGDDRVIEIYNHWPPERLRSVATLERSLPTGSRVPCSFAQKVRNARRSYSPMHSAEHPAALASEPLKHVLRLVDDTGIIQHATGRMPLRSTGYCVDDVARLLPIALIQRDLHDPARLPTPAANWDAIAARSVSFLLDAAEGGTALGPNCRTGSMHNFLSFDRQWLEKPSYGDHVGRAAMALARADQYREFQPATAPVLATLFASIRHDDPVHLRAYMLLARLSCPQYAERKETRQVADSLYTDLCENQADTWVWFEQQVRYDAAVLPTALLRAGACLNDDRFIDAGMRSFDWLHTICTTDNSYRFPGHLGLLRGADLRASGDEQPLEARAFVDASVDAYQLTGDDIYRQRAFDAFSWFQGRNRLGIIMAGDDGGCFDGLGQYDANKNSGAESTLAFITASMSIRSLLATDASSSATVVNLGT